MSQPKEIFVRLDRCMGCHTCSVACAVEHSQGKNLYEALSEAPTPKSRVLVEWVSPDKKIPILCRHCEDAPCLHACISGAIKRVENGALITDRDKCIGCWTCVMVCPYGVIGRHMEQGIAYRCDRCPDRQIPACVEACPTKALVYQTVEAFSGNIRRTVSKEILSGQRS